MRFKAILFDLDGTLLPMDQKKFSEDYFKRLIYKLTGLGYNPEKIKEALFGGIERMIMNDGNKSNENVFWETFSSVLGDKILKDKYIFDEFYENEFDEVRHSCGFNPNAAATINKLKSLGYRIILATNPLFPKIATKKRIEWSGLSADDFEFYTTYENSGFCKPNINYYSEILSKLNLSPVDVLMVGNDVKEDMVAGGLGMSVFLMPEYIINKENQDISVFPSGDFDDLIRFISSVK